MSETKFDSRVQIKLTPEMREKLDEIIRRIGARDVGEVVRDALRLYDIITSDIFCDGNQILSRDGETGEVSHLLLFKQQETAAA